MVYVLVVAMCTAMQSHLCVVDNVWVCAYTGLDLWQLLQ